MVERLVANEKVEGSTPFARSIIMIIWIASYPKSGNTMLRSMLSAYFFTEDGKFSFNLLKNIIQFPNVNLFRKYDIDTTNENEVLKNYVNIQKKINEALANRSPNITEPPKLKPINVATTTPIIPLKVGMIIAKDVRKIPTFLISSNL